MKTPIVKKLLSNSEGQNITISSTQREPNSSEKNERYKSLSYCEGHSPKGEEKAHNYRAGLFLQDKEREE